MSDIVVDGLAYPVVFSEDASIALPRLLARDEPNAARAVLLADHRVAARARILARAIAASGVRVLGIEFVPGGERCKSPVGLARVWRALAALRADRKTTVIAIGGGTITDLAGFAAATYMRGVPWIAVPTTVLAMSDAAIGGKTAIDLPSGKNQAGAFWNPLAVVADVKALRTLPVAERATGIAEVVKAAIVGDGALLEAVEDFDVRRASATSWLDLVVPAARVKVGIVAADPLDRGLRASLNLGHTVGHALEHASKGKLNHGAAVSIGLRAAGLLALRAGMWSRAEHGRVLRALAHCGLPLSWSGARRYDALRAALSADKKRSGRNIGFVLPERLGAVNVGVAVDERSLRAVIRQCAAPPQAEELME